MSAADIEAKKALVTGGAAGLGAALVEELARQSYHVMSLDITEPKPRQNVVDIVADLSDREASAGNWQAAIDAGPFDIAIFNAGISATGKFEELPLDAMLKVLEINARAPMAMTAHCLAYGGFKPDAKLVFVSSLSHFAGYPGAATYAASKDALAVYAKSIRKPLKNLGMGVSVAFPGPIKTEHATRYAPEGADAEKRMEPSIAAAAIVEGALKGQRTIIPGGGNKMGAVLGKLLPKPMTWLMRKIIYDKLDGPKT